METRFPPTWKTPQGIAYEAVATNSPNEERPSGYPHNTVLDQTPPSPQLTKPDRSSISVSSTSPPLIPRKNVLKRRGLLSGGWRTGITYSAVTAAVVLFINTVLTIWASTKYGHTGGVGTIFEGNCKKTKRASLLIHLAINILSTVLLSASNYSMQCLSAPTRAEVDKSHTRKQWLDIGVPSLRNLGKIRRGKLVLWVLLGISSIPLHLVYNSAVFSELSIYQYNSRLFMEDQSQELYWTNMTSKFLGDDLGEIQRLDKVDCMKAYGKQFISDRRNLAIVVSGNLTDFSMTRHTINENGFNTGLQPFAWICNSTNLPSSCNINEALATVDSWTINGAQVQYCISQRVQEKCKLDYSLHIMIAVIICNLMKVVCMLLVVFGSKEDPLVTVGDAVASFLNYEDTTTRGMCTVTKKEIKQGVWKSAEVVRGEWYPRMWKPYRAFWFSAASTSRWVICNLLAIAGITTSLGFLIHGLKTWRDAKVQYSLRSFWDMGLGAVDIRAVINFNNSDTSYKQLVSSILLANLPQALFSFLYLLYNSIFTCMLLAEEWDRFSHQRRPLRVTSPTGAQRSTYFLHLPYRYSIPLMIGSGAMHWLISQSIFLVRVLEVNTYLSGSEAPISIVGYSPIAIVFGAILATLMLVTAFVNGFRRYGGGIPLAASCSAAISAACHPGPQATPAATVPVMWGMVKVDSDGYVGHCSFSGGEVPPPVPGRWYSGESLEGGRLNGNIGPMRNRYGVL